MFHHIFKTRLKVALRDRETLLWTLAFPILLGTLFVFTFGGWMQAESFRAIRVAVVDDEAYRQNTIFQEILQSVSVTPEATDAEKKEALFELTVTDRQEAEALLNDHEISGIFVADDPPYLVTSRSGLSQTISKTFLDEYIQTQAVVESLLAASPQQAQAIGEGLQNRETYLVERPISDADPDVTLIYYFALIAMTCLYGGYIGLREVTAMQANLSDLAARVSVSPLRKGSGIVASLAAGWVVHYASILVLFAYLRLVHSIDFGPNLPLILLACLVGSLTGLAMGAFIGSVSKIRESVKSALVTGISLALSFLAGLMVADIKHLVIQQWPFMRYVNPAVLISDSFYALYFYDTTAYYWQSIGLQLLMILIFFTASAMMLKRRRYASL